MAAPKKSQSNQASHVSFTALSGWQVVLPKSSTMMGKNPTTEVWSVWSVAEDMCWTVSDLVAEELHAALGIMVEEEIL